MMADSKDEQYLGQEEGEYHFSDDQANYDAESDVTTKTAPPKAAASAGSTFGSKLAANRKRIMGGVAVIILIGVVYRVLIPSSSAPATDFSPAPFNAKATSKAVLPPSSNSQTEKKSMSPLPASVVMTSEAGQATPTPVVVANASASSATNQPAVVPSAPIATPAIVSPVKSPASPSPVAAVSDVTATTTTTMTAPMPLMKDMMNRLTLLEQEQATAAGASQADYAQKIADNQTQVIAMRGKIEELTKRLNRIDSSLTQMTQLLQGGSESRPIIESSDHAATGSTASPASSNIPDPVITSAPPKMIYTVQAIIPGRAWLKSESGDTVTVAEGDLLKGYGRITKIDPYDGVVSIDTGRKVVTLSYGTGAD